jgi:hypothetical protein
MFRTQKARTALRALLTLTSMHVATSLLACGAVYPEILPPLRSYPADRELTPPPPEDLLYIEFLDAQIPEKTRDGRQWSTIGGSAPDIYARLFVDDVELIKTPVASDTLKPTWPDQRKANYRIPPRAKVRVELWDSNPINNRPVCVQRILGFHESASSGELTVRCDSGARVRIRVNPAHARLGLGFYYELRSESVAVSRVIEQSPAARAGLKRGDVFVEIQGQKVKRMDEGQIKSLINANAATGLQLLVKDDAGERPVELKAGPVYPGPKDTISLE